MGLFGDMAERFERAASMVPSLVDSSIEATEEQLLDLNRAQLIKGQKSDGNKIVPKYTKKYSAFKKKIGSRPAPTPDLKVDGTLHRSLKTEIKARTIEIEGTLVSKGFDVAGHLEKRYTSEIYGLTDQNLTRYADFFSQEFTKRLQNELR